MINFPDINPVIVNVGPLSIRWYGVMYIIGICTSYFLVKYQIQKRKLQVTTEEIQSIYLFLIFGLFIGARLGYVVFYDFAYYLRHPLEALAVWNGGMSFHGGLIGAVCAGIIYAVKYKPDSWRLSDIIFVTVPIGLGLGRLGNFINGELYGRVTDVPWGMVFPSGGPLPRHPSQIYEFLLEGVILFSILWLIKDKDFKPGTLTSIFLILYGLFRVIVEFLREPDSQIGYLIGFITMGQVLSLGMVSLGIGI
ncbi:MAG: prolipoprotein diacylglyceryl transferase, partial [Eubacteriales bacterium]